METFHGSCHCGFITYDVKLELPENPVASRCNCRVCLKSGYTGIRTSPENFILKTPSNKADLPDYQWRSKEIHRYYCKTCGVHVFGEGVYRFGEQEVKFFSVNMITLDQPQEGLELSNWKIEYYDGRTDNWQAGLRNTPWPGGCI